MKTEREEYENRYRDKLKKIYSLVAVVLIAMIITMATGSLDIENTVLQLENSIVNVDNDKDWWNLFAPHPIPTSTPSSSVTIRAGEYTNVGGYTLWIGINAEKTPREAWIFLSKDGVSLDDKILKAGDVYVYKNYSEIIFQATVGAIFSGAEYDAVRLDNIYTKEI